MANAQLQRMAGWPWIIYLLKYYYSGHLDFPKRRH
jgi:hypothetical protein